MLGPYPAVCADNWFVPLTMGHCPSIGPSPTNSDVHDCPLQDFSRIMIISNLHGMGFLPSSVPRPGILLSGLQFHSGPFHCEGQCRYTGPLHPVVPGPGFPAQGCPLSCNILSCGVNRCSVPTSVPYSIMFALSFYCRSPGRYHQITGELIIGIRGGGNPSTPSSLLWLTAFPKFHRSGH